MPKPQPATAQRPKPTAVAQPKQELVERSHTDVAGHNDQVPDYIRQGKNRGNENVEMGDVVIPRIELVQALSKCLKPNDPGFIEGIAVGDLYNTVTREIYGSAVRVVPVLFRKEWLAWRDQTKGGGFAGAHPSLADCNEAIKGQDKPDEWEATETAQQLVFVLKEGGKAEEAVVSMNKTKLKTSKQWNSLIRLNGNDRFSRVYILHSVDETNANNQDYKNFGVYNMGFAPAEVYARAEALYNALATGERKMNVDHSDAEGAGEHARESGEY